MSGAKKHILMISIPAYGHTIPLLELAKKMAHYHKVTFVVSEFLLEGLHRRHLLTDNPTITILSLPDGYHEEPHENALSVQVFSRILQCGIPSAEKLFSTIIPFSGNKNGHSLVSEPVNLVILDNMIAASAKALHNRGIPYCLFNSMSSTLVLQTLQVHADTQVSEEPIKEMLPFTDALPLSALYKALFLQIHEATLLTAGIIINTAYELERGIIDAIRSHPDMKGVPVYCIGPLMPVSKAETGHESIVKWLDGKKDKSVIYVAFGSIATPKPEDIRELWKALVKTEQPFLWALAKKEQHHLSEEILQKMSRQFEDDENSRCLILDWSPQKLILQHPATAVFISHCGWNSAIEGLATGVPVVAWPMSADQRPNAIELVRSGLGVLLEDTGYFSEKTVDAQDIYTALNEVADFARRGVLTKYQLAGLVWRNRLDDITSANGSAEKDFQHLVTG